MMIFHKDGDYEAFERVLDEGLHKYPVDLIAYQWMPNHWHMVLSPREDGAMSQLMYWVAVLAKSSPRLASSVSSQR